MNFQFCNKLSKLQKNQFCGAVYTVKNKVQSEPPLEGSSRFPPFACNFFNPIVLRWYFLPLLFPPWWRVVFNHP